MKEFVNQDEPEESRTRSEFAVEHNLTRSDEAGSVDRDASPRTPGQELAAVSTQLRLDAETDGSAEKYRQPAQSCRNVSPGTRAYVRTYSQAEWVGRALAFGGTAGRHLAFVAMERLARSRH